MSEVQRFWSHEASNIRCVREADFDRVTAERDAALGREAALIDKIATIRAEHDDRIKFRNMRCDALQQRLTAADERADVLETALKKISVRCVAYIEAEREMPEPSVEVCQTIAEAALKPAEAKARIHRHECSSCKGQGLRVMGGEMTECPSCDGEGFTP